jgi:hypothetical protein
MLNTDKTKICYNIMNDLSLPVYIYADCWLNSILRST